MTATVVVFVASNAQAQATATAENEAAAQALFNEGRALMTAGSVSEACPKFLSSFRFDKRVGTLLNLADCYEKNGQTASAWARFSEAATLAERANQAERAEFARAHVATLGPKLSKLSIQVDPAARVEGLEVRRDGSLIDLATLGVAIPVDPGKHTIEARAPLKISSSQSVEVGADAAQASVQIRPLATDLVATERARTRVDSPGGEKRSATGLRTVAIIAAGVGIVGVGVGTYFGLSAKSSWSDAQSPSHCDATGCDADGVALGKDARTASNISTVAFAVGGVALVGGAVLYILAPSLRSSKTPLHVEPAVGPGNAGLVLRGAVW